MCMGEEVCDDKGVSLLAAECFSKLWSLIIHSAGMAHTRRSRLLCCYLCYCVCTYDSRTNKEQWARKSDCCFT